MQRIKVPSDIEAEQALLGAVLTNNNAYWRVADFLKHDHFYEPFHGEVYRICGNLLAEGKAANPVTINPFMPDSKIGELTPSQYLARLAASAVTIVNAADYAQVIIDMAARRRIISACQQGADDAEKFPPDHDPKKIIAAITGDLIDASSAAGRAFQWQRYSDVLVHAFDDLKSRHADNRAFDWFLPEITQVVGLVRPGNLVGLMSDSGGGKTSLALAQCQYIASKGTKAGFFSIEITGEEAALQMAAQKIKIPLDDLDSLNLTKSQSAALEGEMNRAKSLPLEIIPFADCTLDDIRAQCEQLKRGLGVEFIMIDHAKMIALPGGRNDLFAEKVNGLYRGLKAIAKKLDICIVILIQRNEDWRRRESPRPMISDAYGGGSVRQNLDVFFSLYRPEPLYRELIPAVNSQRVKDKMIAALDRSKGKAWIINHKRRRGEPARSSAVNFIGEYTLFESQQSDDEPLFDDLDFI